MNIPAETQIKATIQPGSVLYFVETTFASRKPHYFVVLNQAPMTDELIVLVCSSSRIEQVKERVRRRHWPESTLVEIKKEEYDDFTEETSIINCNYVLTRTIEQIIEKRKKGELEFKKIMDIALVEKLRKGVWDSPKVSKELKEKYLPPAPNDISLS